MRSRGEDETEPQASDLPLSTRLGLRLGALFCVWTPPSALPAAAERGFFFFVPMLSHTALGHLRSKYFIFQPFYNHGWRFIQGPSCIAIFN